MVSQTGLDKISRLALMFNAHVAFKSIIEHMSFSEATVTEQVSDLVVIIYRELSYLPPAAFYKSFEHTHTNSKSYNIPSNLPSSSSFVQHLLTA